VTEFACTLTDEATPLPHHWEFCVGSGHADLATRADWQRQLLRSKRELGMRHVRFHGLLSDSMGTLIEQGGRPIYSFFNADSVYDALLSMGVNPLVELSFMPRAIASEDRSVFSYAGNISPPKDRTRWIELIKRLASHWLERYGRDALLQWPVEVWNEPNMGAFWTAGPKAYFDLYDATARALKEVSPAFRVGGPVTAKSEWLEEFLTFVDARKSPCDFLSTHYYPTDAHADDADTTREQLAKSSRHAMREHLTRAHEQAFGRDLYLTEWNMTSNSRDDMHDQPLAAAYLVKGALEMSGFVQGSSWWTFSDIFAENYFPSLPFHGGFGLLTLHGIPKPTYRAMQLLHELGEEQLPVHGDDETVDCWVTRRRRDLQIVLSNLSLPDAPLRPQIVRLKLRGAAPPKRVSVRRIDVDHANPRREWVEMGCPGYLGSRDVDRLMSASVLSEEALHSELAGEELAIDLSLPGNGVALVSCQFDEPPFGGRVANPNTNSE
jgi:xylan 1,4-beta-xylosidase